MDFVFLVIVNVHKIVNILENSNLKMTATKWLNIIINSEGPVKMMIRKRPTLCKDSCL